MISSNSLAETIATYQKHGWVLRRVLLSESSRDILAGPLNELSMEADIRPSALDAAWFSRPPTSGETAWELRYLGDVPYALLEYVDESLPEFEAALAAVEVRMDEAIAKKQQA